MANRTKAELLAENRKLARRIATLELAKKKAAAQSEIRYDIAMRAINEGVYDWDIAKGTIYYSDRVQAATGMDPEAVRTPEDWRSRIHPDDLPAYDRALIEHFKGRSERFEVEYRYRGSDGAWRWARQHGIAVRNSKGHAVRLIGSTGEITDLKRVEAALKVSEERYAVAMRVATEGIYDWDVATGDLYLSDKAREFWGFAPGPLKNTDWLEHLHPEDAPGYRQAIVEHFKGRRPHIEHELRVRNAKGEFRWVIDRGIAMRDKQGRATRMVGATSDITQRKRNEEALRLAHEEAKAALERQTATSEILEAIANSPSDVQPVFEAIARSAQHLLKAWSAGVYTFDGQLVHFGAACGALPDTVEYLRARYPMPAGSGSMTARCLSKLAPYQVADAQADPDPGISRIARERRQRAALAVPMLRHGQAVGAVSLSRSEAGEFSASEIALLQIFADQAVIAIENVRLFNETKEALEQQTAISEILRVISNSPGDVQPVLEAVAERAARICAAPYADIVLRAGDKMNIQASFGLTIGRPSAAEFMPCDRTSVMGRSIVDASMVHIADLQHESHGAEFAYGRSLALTHGHRTILTVPLVREGRALGSIVLRRKEVRPFEDKHINLLRTFADQAAIAIENARLFNETKEALEQQTATAEILKVIGSSPTDVQPVFDAIVASAVRLFEPFNAMIVMREGQWVQIRAGAGDTLMNFEKAKAFFPLPFDPDTVLSSRVMAEARTLEIPDTETADISPSTLAFTRVAGFRSSALVPLVREGVGIGAISLQHPDPGHMLTDKQMALVKTLADQAVIAIENVRLFNETKESLERQTATAEILKVIASSPADVQPVLDAIAKSAAELFAPCVTGIVMREADQLFLRCLDGPANADMQALAKVYPMPFDPAASIVARAIVSGSVVETPDTEAPDSSDLAKAAGRAIGFRSFTVAPLLRSGGGIGAISICSPQAGFRLSEKQLSLLKTFADQAVIAIENVRLFNETRESLERQTATAEILKVIASSPSDVQPVFDAIAENAMRLLGCLAASVTRVVGEEIQLAALTFTSEEGVAGHRSMFPIPLSSPGIFAEVARKGVPAMRMDMQAEPGVSAAARDLAQVVGYRSGLFVPMLREGVAIGTINVARKEPGAFSPYQVSLLETFADQAVIAIENVRLFNETKEALERQTATAEILKVISSSPTDTQPVFEAIVSSAARLFEPCDAVITMRAGDRIHLDAHAGPTWGSAARSAELRSIYPIHFDPARSNSARAMVERRTIEVPDTEAPGVLDVARDIARAVKFRSVTTVPLLREDEGIGTIALTHPEPGFKLTDKQLALIRTFADQAVIAIENVRLFNETKEGLERQTATAEILKVIASSPSDVQPVFEAIAHSATRLCGGMFANVFRHDGKLLHYAASAGMSDEAVAIQKARYPIEPSRSSVSGRVILSGAIERVENSLEDPHYDQSFVAAAGGPRRMLGVPMLREDRALGAIVVGWATAGPISPVHEQLLTTFADQAAIAIENVRLFIETKEALERQTATAEILRVISRSQAEVRSVFEAISESSMRLFSAWSTAVFSYDGEQLHFEAARGALPDSEQVLRDQFPRRPVADFSPADWCVLESADMQIADCWADPRREYSARAHARGYRSLVVVPMLRDGVSIGVIAVSRTEAGGFAVPEVELLKTFADQAVIAIENVRLFNETKEALERQTATAEILKVISSSPTDTQPVFEAIVQSAARLFHPFNPAIVMREGEFVQIRAGAGADIANFDEIKALYPLPFDPETIMSARAMSEARTLEVLDMEAGKLHQSMRNVSRVAGFRSQTLVPLVREGKGIGTLSLSHPEPGRKLTPNQLALVQTFADQAVIAIENVRLFNETKESLERQTATADILKVIASSPSDVQPVFDTIASSAMQLINGHSAAVWRLTGNKLHLAALTSTDGSGNEALKSRPPVDLTGGNANTHAVRTGKPAFISDTENDADVGQELREVARARGFRSVLAVPMLREGSVVGTITVTRTTPGPFAEHEIDLLRTFGDQAVIAIENVRLFNETKEALERQTATADILKVIASSPSDVQPVFDAIAESAKHLLRGHAASVTRIVGDSLHLSAFTFTSEAGVESYRALFPMPLSSETLLCQVAVRGTPAIHFDMQTDPDLSLERREAARAGGYRSSLVVPMLREGVPIGTINVARAEPGTFPEHQIELLKTFADQAVIAIENVRLFTETNEALERQTATAEILKVMGSSPTDTSPVFEAIANSALRVFNGKGVGVVMVDGEEIESVVEAGNVPNPQRQNFRMPLTRDSTSGRAILDRAVVNFPDTEAPDAPPYARANGRARGVRSIAGAPMLRNGVGIGAIVVLGENPGGLSEKHVQLLQTFADQAVIAIENVRLFNETKEALERQTATAEILSAISKSPTDARPVFEEILRKAALLCEAETGTLFHYDGSTFHPLAVQIPDVAFAAVRSKPITPGPLSGLGRIVATRDVVHSHDVRLSASYIAGDPTARETADIGGARTWLGVPMIKEEKLVGALAIYRKEVRPFDERQIALLVTFANQAAIAIENARLFKELESRTAALSQSVQKLTALGEVGQAISSTLDLDTVLKTIVSRATQLTGLDGGAIYEYDALRQEFRLQISENMANELVQGGGEEPIRLGNGAIGRTGVTREPTQVPDTLDGSYNSDRKELLIRAGYRAVLAVPLLREDQLLGALLVIRKSPGPFAEETVALLQTFATQSAMAIQNARLFREIAEKGKQLEVASHHKSDFLASMSHELRTPLNAILGFNELILGEIYGAVPEDMKEPLTDIQTSGKHLLRLINNVLDLAKIEAGRMELALADYSVHDTVESVRSTLRPLAAEKGLDFVTSVPEEIPIAHGDFGRITQCLMNLAGNSLKFTKQGKVEIAVQLNEGVLIYRVNDTGIGIPPDKIGSLFTEFKQTDATIASEYGGTGLGLSISKKFIEMHGGRVWVESELGRGSSFIFEVPLHARGDKGA